MFRIIPCLLYVNIDRSLNELIDDRKLRYSVRRTRFRAPHKVFTKDLTNLALRANTGFKRKQLFRKKVSEAVSEKGDGIVGGRTTYEKEDLPILMRLQQEDALLNNGLKNENSSKGVDFLESVISYRRRRSTSFKAACRSELYCRCVASLFSLLTARAPVDGGVIGTDNKCGFVFLEKMEAALTKSEKIEWTLKAWTEVVQGLRALPHEEETVVKMREGVCKFLERIDPSALSFENVCHYTYLATHPILGNSCQKHPLPALPEEGEVSIRSVELLASIEISIRVEALFRAAAQSLRAHALISFKKVGALQWEPFTGLQHTSRAKFIGMESSPTTYGKQSTGVQLVAYPPEPLPLYDVGALVRTSTKLLRAGFDTSDRVIDVLELVPGRHLDSEVLGPWLAEAAHARPNDLKILNLFNRYECVSQQRRESPDDVAAHLAFLGSCSRGVLRYAGRKAVSHAVSIMTDLSHIDALSKMHYYITFSDWHRIAQLASNSVEAQKVINLAIPSWKSMCPKLVQKLKEM